MMCPPRWRPHSPSQISALLSLMKRYGLKAIIIAKGNPNLTEKSKVVYSNCLETTQKSVNLVFPTPHSVDYSYRYPNSLCASAA